MKLTTRSVRRSLTCAIVVLIALVMSPTTALAWYDNNLPAGCTFTASPQTPYVSGGRIYSKVSFKISGCTGSTFYRTHGISEASSPQMAFPYYSVGTNGKVPDNTSMTISMPCKRGTWATTLSLDFGGGKYGFAQSGLLSTTC